jgi:transketolase
LDTAVLEQKAVRLEAAARQVRLRILEAVHAGQSGHPGASLCAADILTALYFEVMRVDPANPTLPDRDRFVLSKGHSAPVQYAALAVRGYYPVEEVKTLRQMGTRLQGHPVAGYLPGIEATTGSLGMGACQAVGMALEARMVGASYNIWALLGDGELDEGAIWETAATAAKYKLGNLVFIIDNNGLQSDGPCQTVMPMEPIDAKFEAFNWTVMKTSGHDMKQLLETLLAARDYRDGPVCVIAKTVKGQGVSFMENNPEWHAKAPNDEEFARAAAGVLGRQS